MQEESISRRKAAAELTRARRIGACLNRSIRQALKSGDWDRVRHWQLISLDYYEVDNETKQEILREQKV